MEWSPENNTTPWGLLTESQKEELKARKHGFTFWSGMGEYDDCVEWLDKRFCGGFYNQDVYRAKPAPVVSGFWVAVYKNGAFGETWATKNLAVKNSRGAKHLLHTTFSDGKATVVVEEI